jgi:hypothetical protein
VVVVVACHFDARLHLRGRVRRSATTQNLVKLGFGGPSLRRGGWTVFALEQGRQLEQPFALEHNLRHPDEHGAARPAGPGMSASQPEPFVDPNKCSYQPPSSPGLAKVDGSSIALAETVFFETGSARIEKGRRVQQESVQTPEVRLAMDGFPHPRLGALTKVP